MSFAIDTGSALPESVAVSHRKVGALGGRARTRWRSGAGRGVGAALERPRVGRPV